MKNTLGEIEVLNRHFRNDFFTQAVAVAFLFQLSFLVAEEDRNPLLEGLLPKMLEETDFEYLKDRSPFVRTLNPSESLILVGLARIDGELVATLRERVTKKTHILTTEDNEDGWSVVGVEGDLSDLGSVEAQISFADQVYPIRYDQRLFAPPSETDWRKTFKLSEKEQKYVEYQAKNFRRGIRGDGYRGQTPPELANKLSRLSQPQREVIIARLTDMINKGVSNEDRQKAVHKMTDHALNSGR